MTISTCHHISFRARRQCFFGSVWQTGSWIETKFGGRVIEVVYPVICFLKVPWATRVALDELKDFSLVYKVTKSSLHHEFSSAAWQNEGLLKYQFGDHHTFFGLVLLYTVAATMAGIPFKI